VKIATRAVRSLGQNAGVIGIEMASLREVDAAQSN
jgi:hypothetical protein